MPESSLPLAVSSPNYGIAWGRKSCRSSELVLMRYPSCGSAIPNGEIRGQKISTLTEMVLVQNWFEEIKRLVPGKKCEAGAITAWITGLSLSPKRTVQDARPVGRVSALRVPHQYWKSIGN